MSRLRARSQTTSSERLGTSIHLKVSRKEISQPSEGAAAGRNEISVPSHKDLECKSQEGPDILMNDHDDMTESTSSPLQLGHLEEFCERIFRS